MEKIDKIGAIGNNELIRNASQIGATGAQAKETKMLKSEEPRDTVNIGKFKFKKSEMNDDGRISVIIEAKDAAKLAQLKKEILSNPNNRIKADLPLIGGFAAEVDPDSLTPVTKSKGMGKDVKVFLDGKVSIPEPVDKEFTTQMDVAVPTLGVEKLWAKGITGKGVTVAVVDTGIAQHPDLKEKIVAFHDIVNNKPEAYDDQGHGTHCSGILAGTGKASDGKFKGVAPDANLVGVKVLDGNGSGSFSDVIAGIQWVVDNKEKLNIDVLSMSLGGSISESAKDDPVCQAVEAAVKKGIITCVAAGNSGPSSGTIGTPGNAPNVITVGAMDDRGTTQREDDKMASFSSRGPTKYDKFVKPDVSAPGVNITAPKANSNGYVSYSGTSMATPYTAGVMALLKSVDHQISPAQAKELTMATADKFNNYDANTQGAGVIDPVELIDKATA